MGVWVDRAERFEASFSLAARFDCVPDIARARVAQFLIKQHCGKTGILNMPGKPKDAAEMKKGFMALETMCTQGDGASGKCSLMRASPTRRTHNATQQQISHCSNYRAQAPTPSLQLGCHGCDTAARTRQNRSTHVDARPPLCHAYHMPSDCCRLPWLGASWDPVRRLRTT